MTTIVTRTGKGSPLTHVEVDNNFTNLNTAKLEAGAIALGSQGTPSISFTGDTNTGIFSNGADQLSITTAGVQRFKVGPNGHVALGEGSTITDFNFLNIQGSNATHTVGVVLNKTDATAQIWAMRNTGPLTFYNYTANTAALTIDTSGRLLVGTTTNSTSAPLESFRLTGQTSGVYEIGAFTSRALVGGGGVSSGFGGQISLGIKDDNVYSTLGAITYQTDAGQTAYGRLALQNKHNGTLEDILVAQYNRTLHFPQVSTTASSANAFLDSASSPANQLLRSTSSLRYKTGIENIEEERSAAILGFRPVWYRSLASADRNDWSWYGLIAEEVAEIEPRLVHWTYLDDSYEELDGKKQLKPNAEMVPDGVQYDRLTVLLLDVVKRQQQAIEALESRITAAGIE